MSFDELMRFSAGSANDTSFKNLWVKGAAAYIPRLLDLLKLSGYTPTITRIEDFETSHSDELGNILRANRSDKSTTHNYHIIYSYILNNLGRDGSLDVLEIGLGTNNPTLVSSMGSWGRPGASLYAWESYLPNSNIYGADVDKDILFQAGRIKTSFVDQMDMTTFSEMQSRFGTKYDMIIDDGLHSIGANINTLLFGLENVKDNGWVVIEDIEVGFEDNWYPIDYILKQIPMYECFLVKSRNKFMYIVHKKPAA